MLYKFRVGPEAMWFVLVAVLTPLLQALVTLDASALADPKVWLLGIGTAMLRAFGGAALAVISGQFIFKTNPSQPDPPLPPKDGPA